MTQPLTVLRATLEVAAGTASSVVACQTAINRALAEVARVADSMGLVQDLVMIGRDRGPVSPVDLGSIIAIVRDDLECLLHDAGVTFKVEVPEGIPPAFVSAAKLRQCLFHLVQQALRSASVGDAIVVHVEGGYVLHALVRLEALDEPNPSLVETTPRSGSPESRDLVLATALAASQGMKLRRQAWPYEVQLDLPVAGPLKHDPEGDDSSALGQTGHADNPAMKVESS